MRKTCLRMLVLMVLAAACGRLSAESTAVGTGKASAVIPLKHIGVVSAMWSIRAISASDCFANKLPTWTAGTKVGDGPLNIVPTSDPTSSPVPPTTEPAIKPAADPVLSGIDSIEPRAEQNTLVVRGDVAAVEKLRARIADFDVPRKQVQFKIEIIEVGPDAADELESALLCSIQFNQKQAEPGLIAALRSAVSASRARVVCAPILSTVDCTPAVMELNDPDQQVRLCALPRIDDNTIDVILNCSVTDREQTITDDGEPVRHALLLFCQRRIEDGKSAVLGGSMRDSESGSKKLLCLIVTAEIVK